MINKQIRTLFVAAFAVFLLVWFISPDLTWLGDFYNGAHSNNISAPPIARGTGSAVLDAERDDYFLPPSKITDIPPPIYPTKNIAPNNNASTKSGLSSMSKDELGNGLAFTLNLSGKPCAKILSVENMGGSYAVTCQEYRNDSSSRVRYNVPK